MNSEEKNYFKKYSGMDYYYDEHYTEPNLDEQIDREVEKYETLNMKQPIIAIPVSINADGIAMTAAKPMSAAIGGGWRHGTCFHGDKTFYTKRGYI